MSKTWEKYLEDLSTEINISENEHGQHMAIFPTINVEREELIDEYGEPVESFIESYTINDEQREYEIKYFEHTIKEGIALKSQPRIELKKQLKILSEIISIYLKIEWDRAKNGE